MSMLRTCSAPGCKTLTLGELCLEHEVISAAPAVALHSRVLDLVQEQAAPAAAPVPHDETAVVAES